MDPEIREEFEDRPHTQVYDTPGHVRVSAESDEFLFDVDYEHATGDVVGWAIKDGDEIAEYSDEGDDRVEVVGRVLERLRSCVRYQETAKALLLDLSGDPVALAARLDHGYEIAYKGASFALQYNPSTGLWRAAYDGLRFSHPNPLIACAGAAGEPRSDR